MSLVCVTSTSGLWTGQDIRTTVHIQRVCDYAPFAGHGHDADSVLGVGVDLGLEDGGDCVLLGVEAGGLVVAIAHVFGVVDDHERCFERHGGDENDGDDDEDEEDDEGESATCRCARR